MRTDSKQFLIPFIALVLTSVLMPANSQPKERLSLKGLPPRTDYKADAYITAAASLQASGEVKAVATLGDLVNGLVPAGQKRETVIEAYVDSERIILLCRMLFTAKPKREFRAPALGLPACLGGTTHKDWPLEPLEVVDGVPFLVVRGYELAGQPEFADSYLKDCVRDCAWNETAWKAKTADEKQKALDKLLASPKWKKLLTDDEKKFLTAQIK